MNLTKAEREGVRASTAKPELAAVEIVRAPFKHPTLRQTEELASGIRNWKRLKPDRRSKESIYTGSIDGIEITATTLTATIPRYVIYLSHTDRPGYHTFATAKDSKEAEIPERIINSAVCHILREGLPQWLESKLK